MLLSPESNSAPDPSPPPDAASGSADSALEGIHARILARFGVVPSFFTMATDPQIAAALYGMAEFVYFDSPLPALFKERLFTYVSRFCAVPYCMARHCGFLLGRGHVAGHPGVAGVSVEHAVAMLREQFPDAPARERLLEALRATPGPIDAWPESGSALEETLFQAAAVAFVMPVPQRALVLELERVLGPRYYSYLALFLGFIRFAHYWTEMHPELRLEHDIEQLLSEQRALAEWVSRYNELVRAELGQQVQGELRELEALRLRAQSLEAMQAALRQEVEARTRVAEAAEASSRAKSAFMATVSHELRTPLNAILGYVDLLDAGVAGPISEQMTSYLARIKATARHQQQVVEEILSFSRLEAGRETVRSAPVALSDIHAEVDAVVAPLAATRGLAFTTDFTGAPATVYTDPGKLRQILLNLLGNAVKFTAEGTVALVVRQAGETVTFTVADSGPGIALEDRERIFEPFTQGDGSTTRVHGGTGLGLAITRRLVGLLGGTLSLESGAGRGATFTVALPLRPPATG